MSNEINHKSGQNPYSTPNTNVDNKIQSRSALPKVIGIISLIMAGLGIFGAIGGLASSIFMPSLMEAQVSLGFSKSYLLGSNILGLLASLWAIFIGIKLVKYKDIGRRHYNYYAIYAVVMSVVTYFLTKDMMKDLYADMSPEMAGAAMDMSSLTSASVFLFPVIIIIIALLLNQEKVKASLN